MTTIAELKWNIGTTIHDGPYFMKLKHLHDYSKYSNSITLYHTKFQQVHFNYQVMYSNRVG